MQLYYNNVSSVALKTAHEIEVRNLIIAIRLRRKKIAHTVKNIPNPSTALTIRNATVRIRLIVLLGFVVKESYRNQGIGSVLIERLEQWGRMKLLSHPSRIHSHRFYERRAYMFTKDQKNSMKKFED